MNYEYGRGKLGLIDTGVARKMESIAPGMYWKLLSRGPKTKIIWYLRTDEEFSFDEARQAGHGYKTFSSKSELLAYCALANIEPQTAYTPTTGAGFKFNAEGQVYRS